LFLPRTTLHPSRVCVHSRISRKALYLWRRKYICGIDQTSTPIFYTTPKTYSMKKGFDTPSDLTPFAAGLKAAGYDYAGRYYNVNNHSKNLTLSEAQALTAAGLRIIAVWENGYPTA